MFESIDVAMREMIVRGTYRFYNADAEQLDDDEYRLHADRASASARLIWQINQALVDVEAKGVGESRAMMSAFQHASGLRWNGSVSLPRRPNAGDLMSWDVGSVFMADLLHSQFRSGDVEILNLNTVGFEMDEQSSSARGVFVPSVKSVRFHGRHLLDSQTACELLTQGQRLVQVSALVRFKERSDSDSLFPVTLKLERDHVAVMTGFG